MVVVSEHFCLCCDVDSETLEEGRRRANFSFTILDIRSYHIHEYWNEGKVRDLVEDVVGGREEGGVWVMLSIEVDAPHNIVHPSPYGVV